jgi:hypothetical protein
MALVAKPSGQPRASSGHSDVGKSREHIEPSHSSCSWLDLRKRVEAGQQLHAACSRGCFNRRRALFAAGRRTGKYNNKYISNCLGDNMKSILRVTLVPSLSGAKTN